MNTKDNKKENISKIHPCKSIIRYVWVQLREKNAKKLADKKQIFENVLSNSSIRPWVAQYMIKKAKSCKSHQEFDTYLVNSKNYFEKNFRHYID